MKKAWYRCLMITKNSLPNVKMRRVTHRSSNTVNTRVNDTTV